MKTTTPSVKSSTPVDSLLSTLQSIVKTGQRALDGESNDAEHDALFEAVEEANGAIAAHLASTGLTTKEGETPVLSLYRKLHDGLSDMIESRRLVQEDIPDDYYWLVDSLAKLAGLDPTVPRAVQTETPRMLTVARLALDAIDSERPIDEVRGHVAELEHLASLAAQPSTGA